MSDVVSDAIFQDIWNNTFLLLIELLSFGQPWGFQNSTFYDVSKDDLIWIKFCSIQFASEISNQIKSSRTNLVSFYFEHYYGRNNQNFEVLFGLIWNFRSKLNSAKFYSNQIIFRDIVKSETLETSGLTKDKELNQ